MGRRAAQRQGQGRPGPFVIVRIRVVCEQERWNGKGAVNHHDGVRLTWHTLGVFDPHATGAGFICLNLFCG